MMFKLETSLVLVFISLVHGVQLNIRWLNETTHDNRSVCNDGSPSAYYFKYATDSSFADQWLFHLQGGGQCFSEASCQQRSPSLMSSTAFSNTIEIEGLFNEDASLTPFHAMNKVYVPYCSSDGWIGDAAAGEVTWGLEFRGQRIIRSALADLVAQGKISSESVITFGGTSAGARGMMNNVDFLSSTLPSGALVRGVLLDSPYYIDIEPFSSSFEGFQNQTMEIYNRYNVSAVIPSDCSAVYSAAAGEEWKCLYGQYRMPFVKTPYLLIASQYDSYQLSNNIGEEPVVEGHYLNPAATEYAKAFAEKTRTLLSELQVTKTEKTETSLIFSWACYNHAVCQSSRYYSASIDGFSENDASTVLLNTVDMNTVAISSWIENCTGSCCGTDCS